jgi:uncharacterized protein (TIGR02145 family)
VAGTKLKATSGWNNYSGVPVGTDEFGFEALAGGQNKGTFSALGNNGVWWTSTEYNSDTIQAYYRAINYNNESVGTHYNPKTYMFSIRCVKDE